MFYPTSNINVNAENTCDRDNAHGHRIVLQRTFFIADLRPEDAALIASTATCIGAVVAVANEPMTAPAGHLVPLKIASLAEHLARSTPEELIDAARAIGIDNIWDRMIEPLIS
jgi:hypothetical protein